MYLIHYKNRQQYIEILFYKSKTKMAQNMATYGRK